MREFIKGCAGLFVVLGIVSLVIGAVSAVMAMASEGFLGLIPLVGGILGGAGVALIGGATYVLCSIDERLEHQFPSPQPAATVDWE